MTSAKKFILKKMFVGFPKSTDIELVEETLPEPKENEILIEALFLSVDPYMRLFADFMTEGNVVMGEQVAKVTKSKNKNFPVGSIVLANVGWRNKSVGEPEQLRVKLAYNTGNHSKSLALGVIGMPGITSYVGVKLLLQPKPGNTLFVNSAAGVVGTTVGQIAKILGCRVVGCAGTDEKCAVLKSKYGFDEVFNYKTENLADALKRTAPNGIDVYFDNVGGKMASEVIINHLNHGARLASCGCLSAYNSITPTLVPDIFMSVLRKEIKIMGFIVTSFLSHYKEATETLLKWVDEGKLKYKEEVLNGFEKMPDAFFGLLDGSFSGKVIVKA